jgi:signal transduction histidine kinase
VTSLTESRSWWRILGPWPLRPMLIAGGISIYLTGVRNSERIASGIFDLAWITDGAGVALGIGVACGIFVQLGVLWQRRFGVRVVSYVVFVIATAALMITLRIVVGDIEASVLTDGPTILGAIARISLVMFIVLSLSGWAGYKLARQVEQTQEALELARRQQAILLQGDEFTRRQISGVLHDRVQARLIAACLELQMMNVREPDPTQRTIDSVVMQLEEIRSVDVRRVARALSPQLGEVDLESALAELAGQYQPGMHTTITVDSAIESKSTRPPRQVLLGAYRIIEQALLNSAGHGAARQCEVEVHLGDESVFLSVNDDGRGLPSAAVSPGFGSTLMTAWSDSLGGTWSVRPGRTSGALLTAEIPVRRS